MYMVKTAIFIIVFYLVYLTMLKSDTAYGRNRIYIILSIISALLFPFITLQTAKPLNIQEFGKMLSVVFITAEAGNTGKLSSAFSASNLQQTLYTIYFIVASLFILKLVFDLINLTILILRHREDGSRIIRFRGLNTSGFSAMGYIFINNTLSIEDASEIIKHEQNHLKRNHFIDIIFLQLVKAFQWFNPTVYLFDRSIRAIHEYQADKECLRSGIPVSNYQKLLLNQLFKSKAFNLTNSFSSPSLLKQRMVMMTKKPTPTMANIKILAVIPVTILVLLAISAFRGISVKEINLSSISQSIAPPPPPPPVQQSSGNTPDEEENPFVAVEQMPLFPGGEKALLEYLASNTIYPEASMKQGVMGKVILRFCITSKGTVSQVSVLKGISPELDAEAIRVVKTLPSFIPGKQGGKPVPVWYMVPIAFTLK